MDISSEDITKFYLKYIKEIRRMKLLFLSNVPSPYRVDFFNELGKYCDLTVLFEKSASDERDISWKEYKFNTFRGVFLKGKSVSVDTAFCPEIIKYIRDRSFNYIICTTFTTPTGMWAIQYMKRHKIPYYLECDGGFAKNGQGIKERIKKFFISGAEGYFSTGRTCNDYYLRYGANSDKLIFYPFSSLKEKDIIEKPKSFEEKQEIRRKLGIREEKVVLAVGQFIYRKGFDILLEAAKNIIDDTGIYFVGGTPTEEYIEIKKKNNLRNVHFIGFKKKNNLKEYFMSADVFVLPTREDIWGLVIEEAMACGLPIISTEQCAAALELVKNGRNGYIIPVENVERLTESILSILSNKERIEAWGMDSIKRIQLYTIEEMVKRHLTVLGK